MDVAKLVFDRKHKMCLGGCAPGDGSTAARQFDAVLMSVGFKCTGELLTTLSRCDPAYVIDQAVKVIGWAREAVGAHRQHNVYFIDFPANVPDTMTFWADLLTQAVSAAVRGQGGGPQAVLSSRGQFALDLLSLPGYGRYQHTYEEMLAHHAEFEPLLADRMTLVHLGGSTDAEGRALFDELCGSAVPLSGDNLDALRFLAASFSEKDRMRSVPVRENLAAINAVRARHGMMPLAGTVTDILRCAAELSGSDVTLAKAPKFKSLPRGVRHQLMAALNGTVSAKQTRLSDVPPHAELWKRLGERLHPHEFGQFPYAQSVFEVARGDMNVRSRASVAETAFKVGAPEQAARVLREAPGMLWRQADRILRMPASPAEQIAVAEHLAGSADFVSARVLLSVREHLMNRVVPGGPRIFPARSGRAYVTSDHRALLDEGVVKRVNSVIDTALLRRLPQGKFIVVDPAILGAALPLSGKAQTEGLGVWPRGSVSKLDAGEWLRFYFYWKQKSHRTDYDLSVLLADEQFNSAGHVSYTNLRSGWAEHSGDLTDATDGATEFINVRLEQIPKGMTVVPQLYLFNGGRGWGDSGETFDQLEENFFGFMTRSAEQKGEPFVPRTVRMKTVLRGEHITVMPVVFFRGDDGDWYAKWLHLGLKARASGWGGHRVEENKLTTGLLGRSFMTKQYLQVRYLVDALRTHNSVYYTRDQKLVPEGEAVTYIGVEQPEGLPAGSKVFTLGNLGALIPE